MGFRVDTTKNYWAVKTISMINPLSTRGMIFTIELSLFLPSSNVLDMYANSDVCHVRN